MQGGVIYLEDRLLGVLVTSLSTTNSNSRPHWSWGRVREDLLLDGPTPEVEGASGVAKVRATIAIRMVVGHLEDCTYGAKGGAAMTLLGS